MPATLPPVNDNSHRPVDKSVQLNQLRPERNRHPDASRPIRVQKPSPLAAMIAGLACFLSAASACNASHPDEKPAAPLPSVVRTACGHPGSTIILEQLPMTIRHRDCDLTGVQVRYGMTGITVPSSGIVGANADGISSSTTLIAEVDPATGDVTLHE
jgi:hypothetical protein